MGSAAASPPLNLPAAGLGLLGAASLLPGACSAASYMDRHMVSMESKTILRSPPTQAQQRPTLLFMKLPPTYLVHTVNPMQQASPGCLV